MLNAETLPYLLHLLEAKRLDYAALSLLEYDQPLALELINGGILKPAKFEAAVSSDRPDLTTLELVGYDHGIARYFDPQEGIVEIDPSSCQVYRLDFGVVARALFPEIVHLAGQPLDLHEGLVWDFGTFGKSVALEVWFARRLWNSRSVEALELALRKRPSDKFRLVLSSTPSTQLRKQIDGALLIAIADVVNPRTPTSVDMTALKERAKGTDVHLRGQRVALSADRSQLTIDGNTLIFRGAILQAIIAELYKAHKSGVWVTAADLLTRSNSAGHSLDKAFGGRWKEIRPYLENRDGRWRINPEKTP